MDIGLETLFEKKKHISVSLDAQKDYSIQDFLIFIADNYLTERRDLFLQEYSAGETAPSLILKVNLRPGILCLINDSDWELHDTLNYKLIDGDEIIFISTLHGG